LLEMCWRNRVGVVKRTKELGGREVGRIISDISWFGEV
jgi:hypothetical protein